MRRSQVSLDYLRVLLHLCRRALGDLLAVVEHHHAVADVHHQPHVVLDEQHRHAIVAHAADQLAERDALRRIHAGRGLVEREQLGLGGQRAGNFQTALVAVRQAAGRMVRFAADAHVVEQLQRPALNLLFLRQGALVAEDRAEHAGSRTRVAADHHVFERGKIHEQADVLEGAADAGGRDLVRLQAGETAVVEPEVTAIGRIDAGENIEQRGLAGTVGTDQAVDLALADGEGDIIQRLHAAEPLCNLFCNQQVQAARSSSSRLRTAEGSSPAGRNSMTSTSARPNSSMRITSGSTSMRPNSASCSGVTVQRRISGTKDNSSAPRITPQMLPMPPSTTIDTTMIDSTRMK